MLLIVIPYFIYAYMIGIVMIIELSLWYLLLNFDINLIAW